MNIQVDLPRPIEDELYDKHYKRQIGSVTWQPQGLTATIKTISQSNHTLKILPDLLINYYQRKSSVNPLRLDMVKQFPVEICRLLRVPVENSQDVGEVTWHLVRYTGIWLWRSPGPSRNDWVWVDLGNRNIYWALKGFYPTHLISIMKVRDQRTNSMDRLVVADRLDVENTGKITDIRGLVTATLRTVKGPKGTTEIVVSIKQIIGMAHLVPETVGRDNNR